MYSAWPGGRCGFIRGNVSTANDSWLKTDRLSSICSRVQSSRRASSRPPGVRLSKCRLQETETVHCSKESLSKIVPRATRDPQAPSLLNEILESTSAALASVTGGKKAADNNLEEAKHVVGGYYCGDEAIVILACEQSPFNDILVLEVAHGAEHSMAGCRVLLLDAPGNIHSVYNPLQVWTDSYYDLFATLPPVLPAGPLALLGLAGGTAARLLLQVWPRLEVHGWELDPAVVRVARAHFELGDLEAGLIPAQPSLEGWAPPGAEREAGVGHAHTLAATSVGTLGGPCLDARQSRTCPGRLIVHLGDALAEDACVEGGFAAIMVDLFANAAVIPQLQEADTWRSLRARLRPGGRILANAGAGCVQGLGSKDGEQVMRATVAALAEAFDGEVIWQRVVDQSDGNVMALTGQLPDLEMWQQNIPEELDDVVHSWRPVKELLDP